MGNTKHFKQVAEIQTEFTLISNELDKQLLAALLLLEKVEDYVNKPSEEFVQVGAIQTPVAQKGNHMAHDNIYTSTPVVEKREKKDMDLSILVVHKHGIFINSQEQDKTSLQLLSMTIENFQGYYKRLKEMKNELTALLTTVDNRKPSLFKHGNIKNKLNQVLSVNAIDGLKEQMKDYTKALQTVINNQNDKNSCNSIVKYAYEFRENYSVKATELLEKNRKEAKKASLFSGL